MVYGLALRACYGIWYGMAGIAWCMVWPRESRLVYSMAWRASHGIIVCSGRPDMGYLMTLRALHGI